MFINGQQYETLRFEAILQRALMNALDDEELIDDIAHQVNQAVTNDEGSINAIDASLDTYMDIKAIIYEYILEEELLSRVFSIGW